MGAKLRKFLKIIKSSPTKKTSKRGIKQIRKWMNTQPYLPEYIDDNTIRILLIKNNGNVESTKANIHLSYITILAKGPTFLDNTDPPVSPGRSILAACVPLPKLTNNLSRVSVWKVMQPDLSLDLNCRDIIYKAIDPKIVPVKQDMQMKETFIIDFDKVKISRDWIKCINVNLVPTIIHFLNELMRIHVEAIYVVNGPPFLNIVLAILKKTYSPQMIKRIYVCDKKDLRRIFPNELLPIDYGGKEKSTDELNELFKAQVFKYQSLVQDTSRFITTIKT